MGYYACAKICSKKKGKLYVLFGRTLGTKHVRFKLSKIVGLLY